MRTLPRVLLAHVASLALVACGSGLKTDPGASGSTTVTTASGSTAGTGTHGGSGNGSSSTTTNGSSAASTGGSTGSSSVGTTGSGSTTTTTTTTSTSSSSTGTTGIVTTAEVLTVGQLALGNDAPYDLAFDGVDNLYAADLQANVVATFNGTGQGVIYAGTGAAFHQDGARLSAGFDQPWGMVFVGNTLYVMETGLDDAYLRAIDVGSGTVTSPCGVGTTGDVADGICSAAEFAGPSGLATDGLYIYVADQTGDRIRRIDLSQGQVITWAGSTDGDVDAQGLNAKFSSPWAVAVDTSGNVFVADFSNRKIKKIDSTQHVTTFATMPIVFSVGESGRPAGVAVDSAGNVYASDLDFGEIVRWSPDGTLTAQITDAHLSGPAGMKFNSQGQLFVADVQNAAIEEIQF